MAKFNDWEVAGTQTIAVAKGPVSNPKKMTGTRLSAVLGFDKYKTPFGAWCEITRVAEPPFEGNKFTEAGSAIEPKLLDFCKYEVSPHIITPEEFYNTPDPKRHTGYDFFGDDPIFGGMWDALIGDGNGGIIGVVEAKTSSRPQDWQDGVPLNYAVQGLMYAYLLGLDRVFFPVRFMNPDEYDAPEKCECTEDNTVLYELKVSEWSHGGNDIGAWMSNAAAWHSNHVDGNISPKYDEKKDVEYLKLMRKATVTCNDLADKAKDAAHVQKQIDALKAKLTAAEWKQLAALEKDLKSIKDKGIKPSLVAMFDLPENAGKEELSGFGWKVKRTTSTSIDKEALEADGLIEKYSVEDVTYRLSADKGEQR